jgi:hypothetical protein
MEKIKSKIQKLLALATSDNEHEASLALLNAKKLADKHGLSIDEIKQKDESDVIFESLDGCKVSRIKAVEILHTCLCELFSCKAIVSVATKPNRNGRWVRQSELKVYGLPEDVAIVKMTFDSIRDFLNRKTKEYAKGYSHLTGNRKKEVRFSYMFGLVTTIIAEAKTLFKKEEEVSNTTAIVRLKDQLVNKRVNQLFPTAKNKTMKGDKVNGHYFNGLVDGNDYKFQKELS